MSEKKLFDDLAREAERLQKRTEKEAEGDMKRLAEAGKRAPKGKRNA